MNIAITATVLSCDVASIVVLFIRLMLRNAYYNHFDLADHLAFLAVFFMVTSIPFNYLAINWGTANINAAMLAAGGMVFTPEEIHRRTVGSKSVIVLRVIQITK